MRNISFFIVSLWLAGCATLTYQEPTAGPRARVRFVTDTSDLTVLRTYDDSNCTRNEAEWMGLRVGFLFNSSPKSVGMPLGHYHTNAAKEVYVQAGKPIYGFFIGSETPYSFPAPNTYLCGVPFLYTFSEDKDYEVSFKWNRYDCRVAISEIIHNDLGGHVLLENVTFDNRVDEANRGCMAVLKKFHRG
jgi:hypothetical protein